MLGPGKAELLEGIAKTGSISEAAQQLNMSYMRAWTLIRIMNRAFREPVVLAARGGSAHGGATLSKMGERVLKIYRQMERASHSAVITEWNQLKRFLR